MSKISIVMLTGLCKNGIKLIKWSMRETSAAQARRHTIFE